MEEYPMARFYRDVRVGTIGGGSSEIMREIIAKMVIDEVNYDKPASAEKGIVPRVKASEKSASTEMSTMDAILSDVNSKASAAQPIGKTLKFDFGGQQLFIDGTGATNEVSQMNSDADCTIRVSEEDFQRLIKGDLNPMGAVMSGKIKIDGDMGVAMKLQSLFS